MAFDTTRDEDFEEAAAALCNATHPSYTKGGTRYCSICRDRTGVVILKLEELGWQCREDIEDRISHAMDEG